MGHCLRWTQSEMGRCFSCLLRTSNQADIPQISGGRAEIISKRQLVKELQGSQPHSTGCQNRDPQSRGFKVCILLSPKYHPLPLQCEFAQVEKGKHMDCSFRGFFFFFVNFRRLTKLRQKSTYKTRKKYKVSPSRSIAD